MNKVNVEIMPNNIFLEDTGIYDLDKSELFLGKMAGICYAQSGLKQVLSEEESKTIRRCDNTINNGHHSVFEHNNITMYITNIPKMLAMVLNNEKVYATSERSLRYTTISSDTSKSGITSKEAELYNKWTSVISKLINKEYPNKFDERQVKKLAQENARYLVSVFIPTKMVYSASLRQINYLSFWMENYIKNASKNDYFERTLSSAMKDLVSEFKRLNLIDERFNYNQNNSVSLFGEDLYRRKDTISDVYSIGYFGSFAMLAEAQRHRTINYKMERMDNPSFYVPPIVNKDDNNRKEWIKDIESVNEVVPQGELVYIRERGPIEAFVKKCENRLCARAQLEIFNQTKKSLMYMYKNLYENNDQLYKYLEDYTKGYRCTFPEFKCKEDCGHVLNYKNRII